jgi:hypothetical protein
MFAGIRSRRASAGTGRIVMGEAAIMDAADLETAMSRFSLLNTAAYPFFRIMDSQERIAMHDQERPVATYRTRSTKVLELVCRISSRVRWRLRQRWVTKPRVA